MARKKDDTPTTYCADFECTGQANYNVDGYVRVYLWSLVSLDGEKIYWGETIDQFLQKLVDLKATKVWFHNLSYDGNFIIDYLCRCGYIYGKDYECIIDGLNTWYEISITTGYGKIIFWDSLKKFPGQSVQSISKLYGIAGKFDKPDFNRYIPIDYHPYKEEVDYCIQDSKIIAYAMRLEYANGHKGMTLSADAFKSVQSTIGGFAGWRSKMPKLDKETDAFIRDSYKGGWVYVNPLYQNKVLQNVTVYDVNSLYPYVMYSCNLPWGSAIYCKELPSRCNDYLWVMRFKAKFKLNEGYLPTVQIKNNPYYLETEYITEFKDENTVLTMTNIDYEMFKKHYEVWDEDQLGCYILKKRTGLLKDYIDHWTNVKIQATQDKNYALRYIAKRYLNSPYGKTGMRLDRINKTPYLDEDGEVRFDVQLNESEGIYVPYASFVCAQARNITISGAQKHYEDFVYADTDSLHLLGDNHDGLQVDDVKLGAWKIEGKFERAKYIRPKTYIHADSNYNIQEVKCAGMPDNIKEKVTWDNFKDGNVFDGKIMKKRVPGGCMLCPTTFKIKEMI